VQSERHGRALTHLSSEADPTDPHSIVGRISRPRYLPRDIASRLALLSESRASPKPIRSITSNSTRGLWAERRNHRDDLDPHRLTAGGELQGGSRWNHSPSVHRSRTGVRFREKCLVRQA
jgi:hypothetical protein